MGCDEAARTPSVSGIWFEQVHSANTWTRFAVEIVVVKVCGYGVVALVNVVVFAVAGRAGGLTAFESSLLLFRFELRCSG